MRRAEQGELVGGLALVIGGMAGAVWAQTGEYVSLGSTGRTGIIVGTMLLCYFGHGRRLARRQAAEDEAYRFGYDMGEAAGEKRGREAYRPVLVDLEEYRSGNGTARSRTPGAADRG